jgi:hypothetical protein
MTDRLPSFQPCQIVRLDHEGSYLYAEVVQIIEKRQLCWVRPVVLTVLPSDQTDLNDSPEVPCWYDLRHGSDLVLPLQLFRPAMDTEVIPLLSLLYTLDETIESGHGDQTTFQRLSQFVHQIFQAHPEVFQK